MDQPASSLTRRDMLKLGGAALAAGTTGAGLLAAQPAAAQTPKRGGTFRLRLAVSPVHFDPQQTIAFSTMVPLSFSHSRLVKVKAGSVGEARDYATRARPRRVVDPAQRHHLRLQAPQGRALAPEAAGQRARADGRGRQVHLRALPHHQGQSQRGLLEEVDKIEAVDKYTVKFTLKEPFAWFLDVLASTSTWIIAKEAVEKFGDLKRPEAVHRHRAVDARALRARTSRFTFVRNPNYFLPGLPYADGVDIALDDGPVHGARRLAGGPVRLRPLSTAWSCAGAIWTRSSSASPASRCRTTSWCFGGITWMKLEQEPFKDVRVRRALAIATNWQEVLETNAWSQGMGAPNPAVPAALREWSIPIDQLPAEGRRLYEHDPRRPSASWPRPAIRAASRPRSRPRPAMAPTGWMRCR